ncbi:hypothetical protein GGR54DRAFT_617808 [Hypoxylon sp. NC1633]|nr:hypothetical protein GGR54DRAFT_617808 [Hypoxylon sp. NC1633]
MAHGLSGIPNLPSVQLLSSNNYSMLNWREEGKAITIRDSKGIPISSRQIRCPKNLYHHGTELRVPPMLDNVIVSAHDGPVVALRRLQPYIDRQTTICLALAGLGQMEMLNQEVFHDPALRPNYVLCHSYHRLSKYTDTKYSIKMEPRGRMFLYPVPRDAEDPNMDPKTSASLGNQHTQHLVNLLSTPLAFGTEVTDWQGFLRWKLSGMVYQSLADTISVILGCRYSEILKNPAAMAMWDGMCKETVRIITKLPELRARRDMIWHFKAESFRKNLKAKLYREGDHYSQWISAIRRGVSVPVDFMNGYFVKRAKELGLDHSQNSLAVNAVKARHLSRTAELKLFIPLGLQPYMTDLDKIGGGQDVYDPELDGEH